MRHAALAISMVLTLMSAYVLSQLWAMEPNTSHSIQAIPGPQAEETAKAFYQGVNAYLEHGDDAPVRGLLHHSFVTHRSGSSWSGSGDDLLRHLDFVRRIFPGIQVEPEPAAFGNNTVSVTLTVAGAQPYEFVGMAIDPANVVGRLDLLRIERGMVIEHWSSAPIAGQLNSYPALSIDLPFSIDTLFARVQEIPVEAASEPMVNPFRHMALIVTAGEALLDVTGTVTSPAMIWRVSDGQAAIPAPVEPETTVALNSMEAVYLPAGTKFRMWGSSNQDATYIALEFGPPIFQETVSTAPYNRTFDGALWSGIELKGVGDSLTLSLGTATLLPQSTLSSPTVEGMELAWVTGGSIDMAGSGGEIRVRKTGGTRSQLIDSHAMLLAGETAAAGPGSTFRYQTSGDEPATAWFFSIAPSPLPAGPNDTTATPAGPTPIPTPAPRPNPTLS